MRGVLRKWAADCKGAVTVMVTLLLIPAVLVTGTGVDLARVYVAYSELQDANQLAANSALASYDALLQDLYGLYGFMEDDEELADLVDLYIRTAIFGEKWKDTSLGTFQLFYGSDLESDGIEPAEGQDLEDPDVLRRQIEEYAKYRAPVVIVDEILDRLDAFEKVQADAEIIDDKTEIEDKIDEIEDVYREIYDAIKNVDEAPQAEEAAIRDVNGYIDKLQAQLEALYDTRDNDWMDAYNNDDEDRMDDYEKKYNDIQDNIKHLIHGGTIYQGWVPGDWNDEGEWEDGYWIGSTHDDGLEKCCERYRDALDTYLDELDELVELSEKADRKKAELSKMVDDLEAKLKSGNCSAGMKKGLTEDQGRDGKTVIQTYRALLGHDLTTMAKKMRELDSAQIKKCKDLLNINILNYGNADLGTMYVISMDSLSALSRNNEFDIDYLIHGGSPGETVRGKLYDLTSITPKKYTVPDSYVVYENVSADHKEFYDELVKWFDTADGKNSKKTAENAATKIFAWAQEQLKGFLLEPEGAYYYKAETETGGDGFGTSADWSKKGEAKKETKKALNGDLIQRLSSAGNNIMNKALLLTYDSEMFSNYTTKNDGSETTLSGVPLSTDVNYFFQSELEYLYNGNEKSARSNLAAVSGMILLVRFVFNYVASFQIDEVNYLVDGVKDALSPFIGPFAVAVGELVRMAIALGESALDVGDLRNGKYVELTKKNETWKLSISGLINTATNALSDDIEIGSKNGEDGTGDTDQGSGLCYKDYLRFFLLLKDDTTLANRTARLIELNVTYKRNDFGALEDREARQNAMSSAELFDMSQMVTGFSITTTVNFKMLFLSMPIAQQGVNGVIPPGELPMSVTDYRGY